MSKENKTAIRAEFGRRLHEVRSSLGMTQTAMAKDLGTSASYISDMESGKTMVSTEIILGLRNLYNVNVEWFLTGKGSERFIPREELTLIDFREAEKARIIEIDRLAERITRLTKECRIGC